MTRHGRSARVGYGAADFTHAIGPRDDSIVGVLAQIERRIEDLPFRSAFARLASNPAAGELHERYVALIRQARCANGPYNLLVAHDWMLVVPRTRASFEGIPVNSLAFAGALFVRDDIELATVARIGPMAVLQGVSYVVEERAGTLDKDPS